jgi:hypothetical protein
MESSEGGEGEEVEPRDELVLTMRHWLTATLLLLLQSRSYGSGMNHHPCSRPRKAEAGT